jgi:outer membrane lipoprotein SlyB
MRGRWTYYFSQLAINTTILTRCARKRAFARYSGVYLEAIAMRFSRLTSLRATLSTGAFLSAAALLSGCATGAHSPSAKPVLYPNAKLNQVGEAAGRAAADACMARAQSAGLTPDEKNNAVAQQAGKGAAVAGVAAAVGSLVTGGGLNGAVKAGAAGAAVGGAAGGVNGAFNQQANQTYRQFTQRCLTEQGFDVIGWN